MSSAAQRATAATRVLIVVLAVFAMTVLDGCAVRDEDLPDGAAAIPDGITVTLLQDRSDVAHRNAQVRVHNGTDAAITLGAVTVLDPRFVAPAHRAVERESTLAVGASVDVRVQLTDVACDASDDAAPIAQLTLDGQQVAGAAAELFPFLGPMHERECFAAELAASVDLRWEGFAPSVHDDPGGLRLHAEARPDVDVRIVAVRETNLLQFERPDGTRGDLPLELELTDSAERAREPSALTLPLVPARCDPHAVQEDKRGTVFTLDVEFGDRAGTIDLPADPDLRAKLLTWAAAWCGYGA